MLYAAIIGAEPPSHPEIRGFAKASETKRKVIAGEGAGPPA